MKNKEEVDKFGLQKCKTQYLLAQNGVSAEMKIGTSAQMQV